MLNQIGFKSLGFIQKLRLGLRADSIMVTLLHAVQGNLSPSKYRKNKKIGFSDISQVQKT